MLLRGIFGHLLVRVGTVHSTGGEAWPPVTFPHDGARGPSGHHFGARAALSAACQEFANRINLCAGDDVKRSGWHYRRYAVPFPGPNPLSLRHRLIAWFTHQTMSSGDEISPVCACPADDGAADTGRAAGSVPSRYSSAENSGGGAASDDGSSEGTDEEDEARLGQACSNFGCRKRFSHDKHNARTCGARSLECASSLSSPAEVRAEVCPCSNTSKKAKKMPQVGCVLLIPEFCPGGQRLTCGTTLSTNQMRPWD